MKTERSPSPDDGRRSRSPNLLANIFPRSTVTLENNIKTEPLNNAIKIENSSPALFKDFQCAFGTLQHSPASDVPSANETHIPMKTERPSSPEDDRRSTSPNLLVNIFSRSTVTLENNVKIEPFNSSIKTEDPSAPIDDVQDAIEMQTMMKTERPSSPDDDRRSTSPNLLANLFSRSVVTLEHNVKTELSFQSSIEIADSPAPFEDVQDAVETFEHSPPSLHDAQNAMETSDDITNIFDDDSRSVSTVILVDNFDDETVLSTPSSRASPTATDEPSFEDLEDMEEPNLEPIYPMSDEDLDPAEPDPPAQQPQPQNNALENDVTVFIGENADFRWLFQTDCKEKARQKGERLDERMKHFRRDLQGKRYEGWEKIGILWWLIRYNNTNSCRTPVRWQEMIDDGYLTHRTKDSLLNTYLKSIIPCLEDYGTPKILARHLRQEDVFDF